MSKSAIITKYKTNFVGKYRMQKLIKTISILFIIILLLLTMYAIGGAIYNAVGKECEVATKIFNYIELKEIINSAIGAFLGFGASLAIEEIFISIRKKRSIKNIVAELQDMLIGLQGEIKPIISQELAREILGLTSLIGYKSFIEKIKKDRSILLSFKTISNKLKELAYVIYLPIWGTVLQTGDLLEFKNNAYFEELILIYTKITKLQMLVDSYPNSWKEKLDDDIIYKTIAILKIYFEIDDLLFDKQNGCINLQKILTIPTYVEQRDEKQTEN